MNGVRTHNFSGLVLGNGMSHMTDVLIAKIVEKVKWIESENFTLQRATIDHSQQTVTQ